MATETDQPLLFDKLASGDRPSILALGVSGAESLKKARIAVFMVDALGRVQMMPPSAVQVLTRARVKDEDLDALEEERAIEVMLFQGDEEPTIIAYLKARESRGRSDGQ
jgi:hypothetical protein